MKKSTKAQFVPFETIVEDWHIVEFDDISDDIERILADRLSKKDNFAGMSIQAADQAGFNGRVQDVLSRLSQTFDWIGRYVDRHVAENVVDANCFEFSPCFKKKMPIGETKTEGSLHQTIIGQFRLAYTVKTVSNGSVSFPDNPKLYDSLGQIFAPMLPQFVLSNNLLDFIETDQVEYWTGLKIFNQPGIYGLRLSAKNTVEGFANDRILKGETDFAAYAAALTNSFASKLLEFRQEFQEAKKLTKLQESQFKRFLQFAKELGF